jgi:pimeloyl-ACP methyl ester carboxylesterase
VETLAGAGFPVLVISGGHSPAFEAVCDSLADSLTAERAVIPGRGHTVPSTGAPYNERLESLLSAAERS